MANNWVDFKTVKEKISMEMALGHYQINWLRKDKQDLVGRCPIHQGEGERAFHVSLTKNAFNCFSCKARGNVLDFVAAMEKCSVRDAGLRLSEWFSISLPEKHAQEKQPAKTSELPANTARGENTLTNKPLSFQLRGIDHGHPYLASRGISQETAEQFGVGFFSGKASMSGRIVFPIHNERGDLVAYAGRAIDDSEPRYKFPAGFHKSLAVYNLHRVMEKQPADLVVLVEGFFDCMKVDQAGFPCVALMGSSLSEHQEELLVKNFQRVVLMLNGDEPGQQAAAECLTRLSRRLWVRVATVPEDRQPDQFSAEEFLQLLSI